MSRIYTFKAVRKDLSRQNQDKIYIPNRAKVPALNQAEIITGKVEAIDEDHAEHMAKGQIRRLYPGYRLQEVQITNE